MNKPFVSVIIPTYNRSTLLFKAINSVLNQKYKNFELIIVNDGSTDQTAKVVNSFKDQRIRYFRKRNGGQPSALNYAIKKSKGKYLSFCDDDDEYLPNKLKVSVDFLEQNPKYDLCYTAFYYGLEDPGLKLIKFNHNDNNFSKEIFSKGFLVSHSLMYRKYVLKSVRGFNENIEIGNDYDLYLRIISKGFKFGYVDKPTVVYNRSANSMTSNFKKMISVIKLLKENYNRSKKMFDLSVQKEILATIYFREGKYHLWQNNYLKSRKFFLKAIKFNRGYLKPYIFVLFTFIPVFVFDLIILLYQVITGKIYIKDCS